MNGFIPVHFFWQTPPKIAFTTFPFSFNPFYYFCHLTLAENPYEKIDLCIHLIFKHSTDGSDTKTRNTGDYPYLDG